MLTKKRKQWNTKIKALVVEAGMEKAPQAAWSRMFISGMSPEAALVKVTVGTELIQAPGMSKRKAPAWQKKGIIKKGENSKVAMWKEGLKANKQMLKKAKSSVKDIEKKIAQLEAQIKKVKKQK